MAIREIREIGDDILTKPLQESNKDDDENTDSDRGYAGYDV